MNKSAFLSALFEHGRVSVSAEKPAAEDRPAADALLLDFESSYRLDLPGSPPTFSIEVASFAVDVLYQSCVFVVRRDVDAAAVREALLAACPEPPTASAHYSADLVLRFLPDVLKLARAAAEDDPLVDALLSLAAAWPLSSVGVEGVHEVDATVVVENSCLLSLYVDRILSQQDLSRLRDARVREAVEASLGLHPNLAPEVARELEQFRQQECTA